jgi:hypothetical protein
MKKYHQWFYSAQQALVFFQWLIEKKDGIVADVSMNGACVEWTASVDFE